MLGNEFFKLVGLDAVAVNGCADEFCAIQAKALDGGQKCRAFDDYFVARRNHGFAKQVKRLLAAGGDDQFVGRNGGALAGHKGAELLAQRLKAFSGAVLQRSAGVFAQGFGRGFTNAFNVKHGRVRKAAGKADDAGLAQQFEEFTNGRGFNALEAVGELQWHG